MVFRWIAIQDIGINTVLAPFELKVSGTIYFANHSCILMIVDCTDVCPVKDVSGSLKSYSLISFEKEHTSTILHTLWFNLLYRLRFNNG